MEQRQLEQSIRRNGKSNVAKHVPGLSGCRMPPLFLPDFPHPSGESGRPKTPNAQFVFYPFCSARFKQLAVFSFV